MSDEPPSHKTIVVCPCTSFDFSILRAVPRSWGRVVLVIPYGAGFLGCGYDDGVVKVRCIDVSKFGLPPLGALLVATLPILSGRDTVVVVEDFGEFLGGGGVRLSSHLLREMYRFEKEYFERFFKKRDLKRAIQKMKGVGS